VPAELRAAMGAHRVGSPIPSGSKPGRRATSPVSCPSWKKTLELQRRYIECMAPEGEPYDALLDDFEQGLTVVEVRRIFDRLKQALIPLVRAAVGSGAVDDASGARCAAAFRSRG